MSLEREYKHNQKIVSFQGGTGGYSWLRGVTECNNPEKNVGIIGTWDSGGSSGTLRVNEGILPPGDYNQAIIAMMEDEEQLQEAIVLLRDRSEGHPLANQLAAKAERKHHGVEGGIDGLRRLFRVRGRAIPVTLIDVDLYAETKRGIKFEWEHRIDEIKNNPNFCLDDEIIRIYLNPPAKANPRAVEAIKTADKVVFPPGSPYTSIFPHLLVRDIPETILNAHGKLVAVLNLMTTPGEDHHLSCASKWLRVFQYYLGDKEWIEKTGRSRLDCLLVNENHLDRDILEIYHNKGQNPIVVDEDVCKRLAPGLEIISRNFVKYDKYSHLLRHDPMELGSAVLEL